MDTSDVIHILNGSELFAEIGVSILVERSLVTIDDRNKLGMHDLLRYMGREIVREESPKEPEERSRLWLNKNVLDVLSEQTVRFHILIFCLVFNYLKLRELKQTF